MTLRDSIGLRLVGIAALWIAGALLIAGMLLTGLFRDHVEQSFDKDLKDHLEELAASVEIDDQGHMTIPRPPADPRFIRPLSGWYWQVSSPGSAKAQSRSLWDGDLAPVSPPADGEAAVTMLTGPRNEPLRARVRAITLPGSDSPFTFIIAGPANDIEAAVNRFRSLLITTLGTLGLGLLGAVTAQVVFGLRPLRRIQKALADIRAGRAARLEGSFPGELQPLAQELNSLLDHQTAMVERARTHVGNLAHALKTPLAVLMNDAAAAEGPLGDSLRRQTGVMAHCIDHHLRRARVAGAAVLGMRTPVGEVSDALLRTLRKLFAARAIAAERIGPEAWFLGERQDLEEMVGNLLENAFKWTRSTVRLTIAPQGGRVAVTVEDDGPGVAEEEHDTILARGLRLDESVPGSGLGLAIARDLAEIYGGSLALGRSPLGGLKVTLDLPAAGR